MAEVSEVDIRYIGYGKSSIDSDLEYVLISLSFLDGAQCKLLLPQLTPSISSKNNDNPFVNADCIKNGVKYIESEKADTKLTYKLNYYGGSSSSFNATMDLVDLNTNSVLSVKVEDVILTDEKNRIFIGLKK